VFRGDLEYATLYFQNLSSSGLSKQSVMEKVWSAVSMKQTSSNNSVKLDVELDSDPNIVAQAIKNGFQKLDSEIIENPIKFLSLGLLS
jgi:hypothetical protein